jgi:hypothetical protein
MKLGLSVEDCGELADVAKSHGCGFLKATKMIRLLIEEQEIHPLDAQSSIEDCLEGVEAGISCTRMVEIYVDCQGDQDAIEEAIETEAATAQRNRVMWGGRSPSSGRNRAQVFLGKQARRPNVEYTDEP